MKTGLFFIYPQFLNQKTYSSTQLPCTRRPNRPAASNQWHSGYFLSLQSQNIPRQHKMSYQRHLEKRLTIYLQMNPGRLQSLY